MTLIIIAHLYIYTTMICKCLKQYYWLHVGCRDCIQSLILEEKSCNKLVRDILLVLVDIMKNKIKY